MKISDRFGEICRNEFKNKRGKSMFEHVTFKMTENFAKWAKILRKISQGFRVLEFDLVYCTVIRGKKKL